MRGSGLKLVFSIESLLSAAHTAMGGQYKLLCRHRHHHSIQDDNALLECVNTHVVKCQL